MDPKLRHHRPFTYPFLSLFTKDLQARPQIKQSMWTFEPRIPQVHDQSFKATATCTAQFYNPFYGRLEVCTQPHPTCGIHVSWCFLSYFIES